MLILDFTSVRATRYLAKAGYGWIITIALLLQGTTHSCAQIVPDATLPNPSIVTSTLDPNTLEIQGGSLAGSNLFHSFQDFSIPTSTTIEFSTPQPIAPDPSLTSPSINGMDGIDINDIHGDLNIDNIFVRVTGDRLSQIDGQLHTPGTANFFLLNPNGIQFGATARLDIGGALISSTADQLLFADGTSWLTGSAGATGATESTSHSHSTTPAASSGNSLANGSSNPDLPLNNSLNSPLLSVSAPIGLQFNPLPTHLESVTGYGNITVLGEGQRELLAGDPGSETRLEQIRTTNPSVDVDSLASLFATVGIAGTGLETDTGTAIALIGRQVVIDGGLLRVPAGAIVLASPTAGTVTFTQPSPPSIVLETGSVTAWGDVRLTNAAALDTSGNASGDITLRGENLTIENGSIIFARPLGNGESSEVRLEANDRITLQGIRQTAAKVQDTALLGGTIGETRGSDLTLRSRQLNLMDGAVISSITFSGSPGGQVTIEAGDRILLDGNGAAEIRCCTRVLADSRGIGNAGNITIATPFLQLIDGAQIASRAFRRGNGGRILVNADRVELIGSIPITSVASVPVTNFFGTRFPSGLFAVTRNDSTGNGGTIEVNAQTLLLDNLAEIQGTTFGTGQGGDIRLNIANQLTLRSRDPVAVTATETVTTIGNQSFVRRDPSLTAFSDVTLISVGTTAAGQGGNLSIQTHHLDLQNSNILVGTIGAGNGGQLQILADDRTQLDSSTLFSGSFATGNAGNLELVTNNLDLVNGSLISAATVFDGVGIAGNVRLQVQEALRLHDSSQITAMTEAGDGGNVAVTAGSLQLRDRSLLTASSRATDANRPGNGGNLSIVSQMIALLNQSQIAANAIVGNGGRIQISTQGLFLDPQSRITASSQVGLAGVVRVSTPNIDTTQGLVALSDEIAAVDALEINQCHGSGSRFVITNRNGFAQSPGVNLSLPFPTQVPIQLGKTQPTGRLDGVLNPIAPNGQPSESESAIGLMPILPTPSLSSSIRSGRSGSGQSGFGLSGSVLFSSIPSTSTSRLSGSVIRDDTLSNLLPLNTPDLTPAEANPYTEAHSWSRLGSGQVVLNGAYPWDQPIGCALASTPEL